VGLDFVKHFTVKSHFTCIDEATSSNMFLLNSLHLLIEVDVNSYIIINNIFLQSHVNKIITVYRFEQVLENNMWKYFKLLQQTIHFLRQFNKLYMLGRSRHAWLASFSI
jgi:hypothetical protein